MSGPPLHLMLDEDVTPVACHTPIPVAIHWQDEVKAGLDQDIRLGVLEEVPIGTPVTWCHSMVICIKKTGKPRHTLQLPSPEQACVPRDPPYAIPVPPGETGTQWETQGGSYRYLSAPQGYMASGDGYSRRYDEVVADIGNKTKCVNDTLLWAVTIEES